MDEKRTNWRTGCLSEPVQQHRRVQFRGEHLRDVILGHVAQHHRAAGEGAR